MPIDDVKKWTDSFAALKPDKAKSGAWADEYAKTVDKHVTGKLGITGVTGNVKFTFKKDVFAKLLKLATPTPAAPAGIQKFAAAWETAVISSTLVVPPGSSLGAASPPTTWSVVAASLILPPSVAAGKQILIQMLTAQPPVPDASASQVGPAFYAAFKALQASVTGTNSVSPPAGPQPLALPSAPVL